MDKIIEAAKKGKEIINTVNEKSGLFMQLLNSIPEYRANKIFMESIENNPNLSEMQKSALLYQHRVIKKTAVNLNKIYNGADLFLKLSGTSFEEKNPNEDWFGMYNDIAKNISDEEMQIIWSKILASECITPNSVSKKLLSILQIIDKESAETFSDLCNHSIYIDVDKTRQFFYIRTNDLKSINNAPKPITIIDETNLKSLGLIESNYSRGYSLLNTSEADFHYYNTTIHVKSNDDNNIPIGNIMFTNCGNQLANVLYDNMEEQKADSIFLNTLIEYFKEFGKCEAWIVD